MNNHQCPKDWKEYQLASILSGVIDFRGRTPIKIGMQWSEEGDVLSLSANNVKQGYIDLEKNAHYGDEELYVKWMTRGHCEKGDIVFTMEAPLGNVAQIADEKKYILSQRVILLKIDKSKVESTFIAYVLRSDDFRQNLFIGSTGSTVSGIKFKKLKDLNIFLPTVEQQKKIAHILTTIDNLIDKTQTLIDKYTAIKQGMMADLFTRGIDLSGTPDTNPNYGQLRSPYEDAPELYKQTEMGWVPKEWEVVKLESLLAKIPSAMRSGPFGSALLKHELVEEGIPLLGIDNIFVEKYNNTYKRFVTIEKFRELARYSVRSGDVVITIMGTVGRCCVVPNLITKALSSKHLWTMTFDSEIVVPELMCWQLNHASWVKTWFHQKSQGGIMEAIQSSTLKTVLVLTASMAEQEYIFEKYQNICSRINSEGVLFDKLSLQKKGLMQDLLTGKVCVEV